MENVNVENIDIEAIDVEIEQALQTKLVVAMETESLKKIVQQVERSISKKTVLDVYRFIYLDFQEEKIIARAINNNFQIQAVFEANEEKSDYQIKSGTPGSICVPADTFISIVKRLQAKYSSITIEDKQVTVKSGRPFFKLLAIEGSEFPRIPEVGEADQVVTVPSSLLHYLYDHTTYAASTSETRPIITGIWHHLEGKRLTCAGTDSHRLTRYAIELEQAYETENATIPIPVLNEAKKHFKNTDEVRLLFYGNVVIFEIGAVTIFGRLLEGTFPNIDRLIFDENAVGSSFVVEAGPFANMLSNSTVYNPDQPVLIQVKTVDNQLRLSTKEAEVGAFQEDYIIQHGTGADLAIAVNVRFLQDAIGRYQTTDHILFEFMPGSNNSPVGMRPFKTRLYQGDNYSTELYVPVRTDQLNYNAPVEIPDFQGQPNDSFNPFEDAYADLEE